MDTNQIVITDEQGNEHTLEVLFTFNSDETGKKYVLYFDPKEEQPTVFASSYDDNGQLFEVESLEEWEMIEEVFHSFVSQDEEGCGCGHHHGDEECGCGHHGEGECGCHEGEDHECCCGDEDGCCH